MKKFKNRLITAFKVLFVYEHFFVLNISREDIYNMFNGEPFTITGDRCGLQEYNQMAIIKQIADEMDLDELALKKAAFEAEAEINAK